MNKVIISAVMPAKKSAIFLFPHQDDEVGIFQKIVDELKDENEVFCLFFTRASNEKKNSTRNFESKNVLLSYGVKQENILFVGQSLGIEDKCLHKHIHQAYRWLKDWLAGHSDISNIYVPAWEGGHPDHDCLNAIAATLASQVSIKGKIWQFPLYNARNCPPYFYRIQSALIVNGTIKKIPISLINRFRFIRSCLGYPSEALAWVGLFPFFCFNYLVLGHQILQPIKTDRIFLRPHEGQLYYEVRKFGTWNDVLSAVLALGKGG
jgi:LmbE family N-acetylglucosaminyl deacetylase